MRNFIILLFKKKKNCVAQFSNGPIKTFFFSLRYVARCVYATMSVVFLCVNVACASLGERGGKGGARNKTWMLVLVRVLVNDLLFIIEAVSLATSLLLLTRYSPTTSPYLHSKVNGKAQAVAVIIIGQTREQV